ncbi:MAG: hypothetical protein D6720_11050 [Gammaproteobacteria bacterium]|nr:MAG: hypothetical protein D6720_11050 [Gammaproteobacteria bacterium]
MNVFILNTGRCGSTTWIRACEHIQNFSAGHESRLRLVGRERLDYPRNHIEADNRLTWMLGRLDAAYGDDAWYVHLRRDLDAAARSFARRSDFGIMKAWREGVLLGATPEADPLSLALDYLDSAERNIQLFLRDKSHQMEARLETIESDFPAFWDWIGAQGDLDAALDELHIRHNASDQGR